MKRVATALVAALLAGGAAEAIAQPVVLTLSHEPRPRSLRMRPRRAAQAPAPTPPRTSMPPIATPPSALPLRRTRESGDPGDPDDLGGIRDIQQPVSFSINLGYQVEGTQLTGQPSVGGVVPGQNSFARLRAYGFGEGFLSTRGVGVSSLSTYFALRFQIAQDLGNVATPVEGEGARSKPPPIATWFERSGSEFRTGWAELKDFVPKRFGLSALRVRGGSQYVYGPWILHMDGGLVAWETKLLKLQAYLGVRHSDYTRDQADDRARFSGASARVDLRGLRMAIPIAIAGEALVVSPSGASGQPGATTAQVEVDWRPARDFALIGKARTLDGRAASEHLEFRGRYKQVSNLVVQVLHRRATDWRWDPSLTAQAPSDIEARRYLDLGPVLPRVIASIRGGTLIAENVDLFARGALAFDRTDPDEPTTSYNAGYVEAGGALQVRLRRTVALEASVLTRQTNLREPTKIDDTSVPLPSTMEYPAGDPTVCFTIGACQNLPDAATHGETGFTEVGGAVRMSLGARRFSAVAEIYGRKTRYAQLYNDPDPDPDTASDVRGGGRFTIDAWVGQRVRIYAAYDLSSRFEFMPDITGYKALRLIMAGTY